MRSATTIQAASANQTPRTTQRIRLRRGRGAPVVAGGALGRSSTLWGDAGIRARLYRRARGRSSLADRRHRRGLGVSHRWSAEDRAYNARLRRARPPTDRRYLLVSADVVVSGRSLGAVNLEGFVGGAPRRAGASPTASIHVGAEGEVLHDRLRARVGTYIEPSRASNSGLGRLHMTGGAELHLFELWFLDLKASFAFDMSAGFNNILFGVGLWN